MPLPKRSSPASRVARWLPGGIWPLAGQGGSGTNTPRWYRVRGV